MNSVNENSGDLRRLSPFGAVVSDYHGVAKREAVFEVLWEHLKMVPFFQRHFGLKKDELWALFVHFGITACRIEEELLPNYGTVYLNGGDDYEPEEEMYYNADAGLVWQNWDDLLMGIKDRKRLETFLQKNRSERFEAFEPDVQVIGGLTFDFVRLEIRCDQKIIGAMGERSAKLAKFILAQRGRKFEYIELAEMLGETNICNDWRSSYNYKRSLDKLFERLNRRCGKRIFHFAKDSVFVEA